MDSRPCRTSPLRRRDCGRARRAGNPRDGVYVTSSALARESLDTQTFTHEIAHYLGLLHVFQERAALHTTMHHGSS